MENIVAEITLRVDVTGGKLRDIDVEFPAGLSRKSLKYIFKCGLKAVKKGELTKTKEE